MFKFVLLSEVNDFVVIDVFIVLPVTTPKGPNATPSNWQHNKSFEVNRFRAEIRWDSRSIYLTRKYPLFY